MTESSARPPSVWMLWANPVFLRYCRSRLRPRALMASLLLTVVLSSFAYLITPMLVERVDEGRQRRMQHIEEQARRNQISARTLEQMRNFEKRLGRNGPMILQPHEYQRFALIPLLGIQALILFLLGTGQVSGGMTGERDEGMVDYQRLTPTSAMSKVAGYLFGLPVREWIMFLSTLPFTVLALWRGRVPESVWVPVAVVFFSSVLLYHLTGLVTGTVLKNRRWAFLLCMGLIFLLYTLVPQGARMGLPFLRYVTMWPAAMEAAQIFPDDHVRAWRLASGHVSGAGVNFFHWNFSELAFTLMVQGSFIVTMLVMVWRKWRQADCHLLSRAWAFAVFAWLCVLPVGNALPGIRDGSLFPGRGFAEVLEGRPLKPTSAEALIMCGFYGLLMMMVILGLIIMMTPAQDSQARGLRRAAKLGRPRAPFFADESSAFAAAVILTAGGAASWAWFTRSVLGSEWFRADPGWPVFLTFLGILAPVTIGLHAMLEAKGGKWPFLAAVFLGIVPVLGALVILASTNNRPLTAMIAGLSPLIQPFAAVEQAVFTGPVPANVQPVHDSVRLALRFWPAAYGVAAIVAVIGLRRHWRRRRLSGAVPEKSSGSTWNQDAGGL